MKFTPRPYQQEAIEWLLSRRQAALFSGCGLGKTAVVLTALKELLIGGGIRGALIVAPKRVAKWTWPQEAAKWSCLDWLRVSDVSTAKGLRDYHNRLSHVYTINYERLPGFMAKHYRRGTTDVVVWDELSKAKNHTSIRIRCFSKARKDHVWHWGLTGTPQPNSALDLFAQIRLLDGGERFGKSYYKFRKELFKPTDYREYNWEAKPGSVESIYDKISNLALVQRSSQYLDIPDVLVEDVPVTLDAEPRAYYKEMQKEMVAQFESGDVAALSAAVLTGKLAQMASGYVYDMEGNTIKLHDAKITALQKVLRTVKAPLLVAANYRHETEAILQAVPGAEPWSDKTNTLERWNAGKIRCLVAHPASIGHGLNLQYGGSNICWFSPTWSRELYDQFNARIARQGQAKISTIYRILAVDTIDEAIVEALREKSEMQNTLLTIVKLLQS